MLLIHLIDKYNTDVIIDCLFVCNVMSFKWLR